MSVGTLTLIDGYQELGTSRRLSNRDGSEGTKNYHQICTDFTGGRPGGKWADGEGVAGWVTVFGRVYHPSM